ncbi:MAG: CapA family protein [Actinobacteria bacterium]|nr:CapA family protein [Actinomycetota bacterium]
MTLLGDRHDPRAAVRVAIAGDYLPAGLPGADAADRAAGFAARLARSLGGVDALVLNLECPVDADGLAPVPKPGGGDPMRAPVAALAYLSELGAGTACIANNHIYDFGEEGVARTRAALASRGIGCLGAGGTTSDDPQTVALRLGDAAVGIWSGANATLQPATDRRRGVEPLTLDRARAALEAMERTGAACRIALVHAGVEGTNRPDPSDKRLLDELARLGFDVVAACHSHRIAGARTIVDGARGDAVCLYGLGSLSSSVAYSALDREGLIAVVGLDRDGRMVFADARALWLEEDGWGSSEDLDRVEAVSARFRDLSREIEDGTFAAAFYRDASGGFLRRQLRDTARAYRNAGLRGLVAKARRGRVKHVRRAAIGLVGRLSRRRA